MKGNYPYLKTWVLLTVIHVLMTYSFFAVFYVNLDIVTEEQEFCHYLTILDWVIIRPMIISFIVVLLRLYKTIKALFFIVLMTVLMAEFITLPVHRLLYAIYVTNEQISWNMMYQSNFVLLLLEISMAVGVFGSLSLISAMIALPIKKKAIN